MWCADDLPSRAEDDASVPSVLRSVLDPEGDNPPDEDLVFFSLPKMLLKKLEAFFFVLDTESGVPGGVSVVGVEGEAGGLENLVGVAKWSVSVLDVGAVLRVSEEYCR